ncbi:hypothetical protein ATI61_109357 [Archangium gephyra]|uniref:Uncharacterized protein n=1 Tax=Archangium gephyra TaxID=48 RepID=A0AAC8Q1U3_9BACT|nr:hypothetical protein [Archangium gephyra]AKI99439.1 Hypothetical protein AA314_01066 [Archangium gephyra]REG28015.1 hypothetical protein ATI61_109357 [Archangium gephyra]
MKKNLRRLVCLVGGATLFGLGCGGAPEEMTAEAEQQPSAEPERGVRQQAVYMVCWGDLGLYSAPSTSSILIKTLHYGNHFDTNSQVFWSNGEYWVRGYPTCPSGYTCSNIGDMYVRWAGLC